MKKIKINSALSLNKVTVSKLNTGAMSTLKGGKTTVEISIVLDDYTTTISDITNYNSCDANCKSDIRTIA